MLISLVNLTEKGLANMLEDMEPKGRHRPCKTRHLMESLADSDQRILRDALASPSWSINGLHKALNQRGLEISWTSISRHRNRQCSCGDSYYA